MEGGDQNGGQVNEKAYVVIRALDPPHQPEFPAVSPKVPAAAWYEREVRDMFGIQPVGMQVKRRLVLPDDWPADLHPLRKDAMDYRFRPTPTTEEETYDFINVEGEGLVEVPLGPLHMTSDEPGHFRLYMDGGADCRRGLSPVLCTSRTKSGRTG